MRSIVTSLIFLILAISVRGQIRDINGVIFDNANNPVPFAQLILRKGNIIVYGARTDFEGKYLLKKTSFSLDSLKLEIKPTECYQGKSFLKIVLENDSTIHSIVLDSYNCDSMSENQCKFHNDFCDNYDVKYFLDNPRKKRGWYKVVDEKEKVIYLMPEYYILECCEKKHYCKTHNYRY